jgi:hypothetical protein
MFFNLVPFYQIGKCALASQKTLILNEKEGGLASGKGAIRGFSSR